MIAQRSASDDPVRLGQRCLLGLVPLRSVGWVAPRIDDGHEERACDGCHLVRTCAGEVHIMDGDGLAQIGQGIQRREFRLGRVAGGGVAIIL